MGRKVWVPVVSGPLTPYAAGFWSWLVSRAYSRSAAADRLYQFDQLSRWLAREGLGAGELTGEQAERFARERRAAGLVSWSSPRSVALPLEYLRQLGAVAPPSPACPVGPLEELLADYGRYLSVERGLCGHTVLDAYVPAARLFLSGLDSSNGLDLARMAAVDVSSFLARECPKRSVSGARDLVCALRSLLRYLHLAGLITMPLVWAVPVGGRPARPQPAAWSGTGRRAQAAGHPVIGARSSAGVTSRSCCCWPGWGYGPVRSPRSPWTTSTGGPGCCWSTARAAARTRCRCRPMSARRSCPIFAADRGAECRALFLRVSAPRQGLNRCTVAWVVRAACDRAGLPRVGCAPAASHRRDPDAAGRGDAAGDRTGPSSSRAEDHRDLRQGRPRCAADAGAPVAAEAWHERAARGAG